MIAEPDEKRAIPYELARCIRNADLIFGFV